MTDRIVAGLDVSKAHKVALVAVMRRLVILTNVLLRDDCGRSVVAPRQEALVGQPVDKLGKTCAEPPREPKKWPGTP